MKVSSPALGFLVVACLLLPATTAQAYIDPGTGSLIVQGLIAAIAGAAAVAKLYWYRIKAFFRGAKRPPQPPVSDDEPGSR